MSNNYKFILHDICSHLKEKAELAQNSTSSDDFDNGYRMAMYEVISLIHQQAKVFQIDLKDVALEDIDPERDFLFRNNSNDS